jgi:hypothetical protein
MKERNTYELFNHTSKKKLRVSLSSLPTYVTVALIYLIVLRLKGSHATTVYMWERGLYLKTRNTQLTTPLLSNSNFRSDVSDVSGVVLDGPSLPNGTIQRVPTGYEVVVGSSVIYDINVIIMIDCYVSKLQKVHVPNLLLQSIVNRQPHDSE